MINKKTLTIQTNISEQICIESCLNMKASGLDSILILMLFALEQGWHIDKVTYYFNLLEEVKCH